MFNKILIVNRGEIAVRIIKACREMNIKSAVIYSDADKSSLHVRIADEAYLIGPPPASESYLHKSKIIDLAKRIGADAIHPGYGFLSENSEFIKMVEESGIEFIGPSSRSVELMGDKTDARRLMQKHNVPIVPGTTEAIDDKVTAKKIAREIGYPIMLKASSGGGGKGMRKIFSNDELDSAFDSARNESLKAFGKSEIYIEKLIVDPKHIEVQIFADKFGNYIHLFERDCSIQRRQQKVVEEAPSIFIDDAIREKITTAAINAAKACNYYNAGTIEFLMDKNKNFYFLEMNTRLQVEHPVTEMITGVDLVKMQIRVANGEKLNIKQGDLKINGHAIECRIYAEDVDNNFSPSTGKILHHRLTSGPGIRIDRGIDLLSDIPIFYDPLLSKVTAWGNTRNEAIQRMQRALKEYQIIGVITNIPAFNWLFNQEKYLAGNFNINFLEKEFLPLIPQKWNQYVNPEVEEAAIVLAALLKNKESEFKLSENKISSQNKWFEQFDE
ncbi:MAG: acetyl-CoA carboxylase biotin carboxylase subunit [Bacteroidota bacterium]